MSRFQNFETALRAVLIIELIRINFGPKILRTCFLHWAKDISLKRESQVCAMKAEIPPRKPEFAVLYKLRVSGLFLEDELQSNTQ